MTTAAEPDHHQQRRDPAPEHPQGPRLVPAVLLAAAIERPAWHAEALCAQVDGELFYPEQGGSTREAKAICAACPVQADCLAHLLAHDERFGIWAGLSERERRREIPAARAARAAAHQQDGDPPEQTGPAVRKLASATATRGSGRESAPPPGGRHVGGAGLATTLPTEPRHTRSRPVQARARSTFPDRARLAATGTDQPATTHRRASPPTAAARPGTTRTRRAGRARAAEGTAAAAEELASAASAPGGVEDQDDVAAPAQAWRRPPDPPRPATLEPVILHRAVVDVLAGQPQAPELDPAAIATLAAGFPAAGRQAAGPDSRGEWPLRVAAVSLVISGHATRGQTARRFGLPTQHVAHWVARHQQRMPLLEPTEAGTR